MLERLTNWLAARRAEDGGSQGGQTGGLRLAAAVLLVHAVRVDGVVAEVEMQRLNSVLRNRFDLSEAESKELIRAAERSDDEAIELYRFTNSITDHLDQDGRKEIVLMLWKVAMADGVIHDFEDNLVAKVAGLLGVSTRDRVILRQQAQREAGQVSE